MVEPTVLPVVVIKRKRRHYRTLPAVLPAKIVDLNAFRYSLQRKQVERRLSTSLLPELGPPCDVEPS